MMFNIDADLENADWAKSTWDVGISTYSDLLVFLGVQDSDDVAKLAALEHFTALPAAAAMPETLAAVVKSNMVLLTR